MKPIDLKGNLIVKRSNLDTYNLFNGCEEFRYFLFVSAALRNISFGRLKEVISFEEAFSHLRDYMTFENSISNSVDGVYSTNFEYFVFPYKPETFFAKYFSSRNKFFSNPTVKENFIQYQNREIFVNNPTFNPKIGTIFTGKTITSQLIENYSKIKLPFTVEDAHLAVIEAVKYLKYKELLEITFKHLSDNKIKITNTIRREGYTPSILAIDRVLYNIVKYAFPREYILEISQFRPFSHTNLQLTFKDYVSSLDSSNRIMVLHELLHIFVSKGELHTIFCPDIHKKVYYYKPQSSFISILHNLQDNFIVDEFGLTGFTDIVHRESGLRDIIDHIIPLIFKYNAYTNKKFPFFAIKEIINQFVFNVKKGKEMIPEDFTLFKGDSFYSMDNIYKEAHKLNYSTTFTSSTYITANL